MRKIRISKGEYDSFIYPGVAIPVPPEQQTRLVGKVLDVLETAGVAPTVSWEDVTLGRVPLCVMTAADAEFEFSDIEFSVLLAQLQRFLSQLPAGYARKCTEVFDRINATPSSQPPV